MPNLHKKILFLILIYSSITLTAQITITLDDVSGQDVAGSQVTINTTPTNNISIPHLFVINNTGTTKDWLITREIILQPNDWFNYLCWSDLCYGISTSAFWDSELTTIDNTEYGELIIYVGAPSVGNAHYRYSVSTDGVNFVSSVDVIVNITSTASVQEITNQKPLLYPNPAQNVVNVSDLSHSLYDLMVYDYTGRQIIYQKNSTSSEINVSSLTNGNYLFVIKNNETFQTSKHQVLITK